jgi:hypothetical protein
MHVTRPVRWYSVARSSASPDNGKEGICPIVLSPPVPVARSSARSSWSRRSIRDRDLAICHACATVDAPRDWFLTHVAALRGRAGTSTLDIGPALATAQAWALFARGFGAATPDTYAPMGVVAPRGYA